jgi:putative nucleotidyltransferase with HDIG domain
MEEESIGLPNLKVGDHLREAYSLDDRLLLTDYRIENEEDLRELRKVGVRYAIVTNRKLTSSTSDEPDDWGQDADDSNARDPLKNYRECQQLYENLNGQARRFFQSLRDNSSSNESLDLLRTTVQKMISQSRNNTTSFRLLNQLKDQSPKTYTHSVNLCLLAVLFGTQQDYDYQQLLTLAKGALLHDIGKTEVPKEILNKDDKLTPDEQEIVQQHPQEGFKILRGMGCDDTVKRIVREHHERPDGSGYPRGIRDLDHFSLIVAVLDVYEALTAPQPYRESYNPVQAYDELRDEFSGMPEVLEIVSDLISVFGVYPVGSYVQLSNGDIAIVTKINKENPSNPIVKVIGAKDASIEDPFEVNLHDPVRSPFMKNDKLYGKDLEIKRVIDANDQEDLKERIPTFLRDRMAP